MTTRRVESGLRNYRIDFIRETRFAETPTDPDYLKYSGVISSFGWDPGSEPDQRRGLGDADPVEFQKGAEEHSFSIEYDLIKWFTSGGSPHDAAYDGLQRDGDNLLPSSHTIVTRESKSNILEEATEDGGSGQRDTRIYSVGRGGLIDEVTVTGEADDTTVVTVGLEYTVHKARSYKLDQPNGDLLCVRSTDSNDTSQTITLEEEDPTGNSETLTLSGTSLVSTSNTYADLDAAELNAETAGDIEILINTNTTTSPTAGALLGTIHGQVSYEGNEGDLGVPAVGAGSREAVPSGDYQTFVGDSITRAGTSYTHEISSVELTVSNDIESIERTETYGMALFPGSRDIEFEATMFSENATHELLKENLQNDVNNLVWALAGGDLTLQNTVLSEPGERAAEEGEAVMTTDNTFVSQGLTIGEN